MRYQVLVINANSNSSHGSSRLEQMKHQLSRAGTNFTRVSGMSAADVDDTVYDRFVDLERNQRDFYHNLSTRDVARYLNHRQAWQELVNSGADYGIVLEDDTVLVDGFNQLPNRIKNIETPWNFIKLAEPYKKEKARVCSHSGAATVVRYEVVPRGACAYVIRGETAQQLLHRTEQVFRPVDVDMQWWWEMGLNVIGLKPYPVQLSHRLGRSMNQAYQPKMKLQRRYVKWRHRAKFWWLNKHSDETSNSPTLG